MRPTRPLRAALALAAVAALAGCDTIGNPIALLRNKKPAPDEFQVLARQPLQLPGQGAAGAGALPPPRPGAPSPLEPDPQREAIAALIGEVGAGAARGEADPAGQTGPTRLSRGEAALLAAADASAADPDIAATIAAENRRLEADAPYEAPTFFELFDGGPDYDPEAVIDPATEAERLQAQGTFTPVRPRQPGDAEAAERAAAAAAAEAPERPLVRRPKTF